jgi:hypothetical protein
VWLHVDSQARRWTVSASDASIHSMSKDSCRLRHWLQYSNPRTAQDPEEQKKLILLKQLHACHVEWTWNAERRTQVRQTVGYR